jgi:hypothetical protein
MVRRIVPTALLVVLFAAMWTQTSASPAQTLNIKTRIQSASPVWRTVHLAPLPQLAPTVSTGILSTKLELFVTKLFLIPVQLNQVQFVQLAMMAISLIRLLAIVLLILVAVRALVVLHALPNNIFKVVNVSPVLRLPTATTVIQLQHLNA